MRVCAGVHVLTVMDELASQDTVKYIKELEQKMAELQEAARVESRRRNELQVAHEAQRRTIARLYVVCARMSSCTHAVLARYIRMYACA